MSEVRSVRNVMRGIRRELVHHPFGAALVLNALTGLLYLAEWCIT